MRLHQNQNHLSFCPLRSRNLTASYLLHPRAFQLRTMHVPPEVCLTLLLVWDLVAASFSSFSWSIFLLGLFHPLVPPPLGPRHRVFSFIVLQSICLSIWPLKLSPICHCGSSSLVPTTPFVGSCISLYPSIPRWICRDFERYPSNSRMWTIWSLRWGPYIETIQVRT